MTYQRRIDPEPISIYLAFMSTYAAALASINYVKTHNGALPTRTRARLVDDLNRLQDELRHLRANLRTVAEILSKADYPNSTQLAIGNGAYIEEHEFSRYEDVTDQIFKTMRTLHKGCLRLEKSALNHGFLDSREFTNLLGESYEMFEELRTSRELSVQSGLEGLEHLAAIIERACDLARSEVY